MESSKKKEAEQQQQNGKKIIYKKDKNSDFVDMESHDKFLPEEASSMVSYDGDFPASFCTQFRVLFKRTFLSIVRDKVGRWFHTMIFQLIF